MDIKSFVFGALLGAIISFVVTISGGAIVLKMTAASRNHSEAWEYKVVRGRPPSEMEDGVNAAAAQGWDLVAALPYTDSAYAVMRRAKK